MLDGCINGDAGTEILERRWFAAYKAASAMRARCEELLEVMEFAEQSWNRARTELSELETLRDALGEQLAALDARGDLEALESSLRASGGRVMTAA